MKQLGDVLWFGIGFGLLVQILWPERGPVASALLGGGAVIMLQGATWYIRHDFERKENENASEQ